MREFAATLTNAEVRFARAVENAGLASYSQVVKAIERGDEEKIAAWSKTMAVKAIKRQDEEKIASWRKALEAKL